MAKKINNNTQRPFWLNAYKVLDIGSEYSPVSVSFKISSIYMILGGLWILLSDKLLSLTVNDKETITYVSMIKGWVYVLLTGLLIFFLVLTALKKLKNQYHELLLYQEKLRRNAYIDPLTGLSNRLALYENLAKDMSGRPLERKALLFIDTDNFKFINNTMGHSFGNQLIREIGGRLSLQFSGQYAVHRIGGDEFILYNSHFNSLKELEECAAKMLHSFDTPFQIGNISIHTAVSIGISTYPEDGSSVDELMQSADIALYRAKSLGKSQYIFYSNSMQEIIRERMLIEKHLRGALQNNELLLYYQPQLDIDSGEICGFEALLRWNNPELGFVYPLKFISIAEETHMIIPIGEWVLKSACSFLKKLHTRGHANLTISINVSILQLLQESFVDSLIQVLESVGVDPQYLELEITESILVESYEAINKKLNKLKAIGVKIALDDFGQGYSSLSYLRQLPINTLKIDKSFIDRINQEKEDDSLIDAIVMIGHKMGLAVIAEGVENHRQMDYLIEHKCHRIQGYLISKPLPEEDALKLYEGWRPQKSR